MRNFPTSTPSRRPASPVRGPGFTRNARRLAASAAVSVLAALTACQSDVRDSDIQFISLPEVRQRQLDLEAGATNTVLIIDPRSPARYRRGHIPSAINLSLGDIPEDDSTDPRLAGYDRIVVYGDNPGSAVAKAMAKRLIAVGYGRRTVRWFSGGLAQWARAGLPLVFGDHPTDSVDPDTLENPEADDTNTNN